MNAINRNDSMNEYTVVSKNFLFLRAVIYGTLENAAKKMTPIITRNQLSEYSLAKQRPSSATMRRLEHYLDLPEGWFERDIQAFSKLSVHDFNLVKLLLEQPMIKKEAIRELLKT